MSWTAALKSTTPTMELIAALFDKVPIIAGSTGGSANAQTLTVSPTLTALYDGLTLFARVSYTNTGAVTLTVNGFGPYTVYAEDGTSALSAGDLVAGTVGIFEYIAATTRWRLISPEAPPIKTWTPTYGASGSMTFTSVTTHLANYVEFGRLKLGNVIARGTTGGTADTGIRFSLPTSADATNFFISGTGSPGFPAFCNDGGTLSGGFLQLSAANQAQVVKSTVANWGLGANRIIHASFSYLSAT